MLEIINKLEQPERTKHLLVIGTPELVQLAEEALDHARIAFRWAPVQLQLGREAPAGGNGTGAEMRLSDVQPRPLDRILADWREAQLRLEIAQRGSPQAEAASYVVERLREEFRAAQEQRGG
ncbi:MAG TPA: hypothetical protein VMP67_07730 [Candidatus Limnocylindria bacterium]|nr:hypothetical protein [Candidatus Limnocylindria bacterium]